jgi:hypothetical protein
VKFLNYFGAASTDGKYAMRNWKRNRLWAGTALARWHLAMHCIKHQPWL